MTLWLFMNDQELNNEPDKPTTPNKVHDIQKLMLMFVNVHELFMTIH